MKTLDTGIDTHTHPTVSATGGYTFNAVLGLESGDEKGEVLVVGIPVEVILSFGKSPFLHLGDVICFDPCALEELGDIVEHGRVAGVGELITLMVKVVQNLAIVVWAMFVIGIRSISNRVLVGSHAPRISKAVVDAG